MDTFNMPRRTTKVDWFNKHETNPNLKPPSRSILPYEYLQLIILHIGTIKSQSQYEKWYAMYKPTWAPCNPRSSYSRTGAWQGWNHFLKNDNEFIPAEKQIDETYVTYWEAVRMLKPLKIKNRDVYLEMWKNKELPCGLPKWPYRWYKSRGEWLGWASYLSHSPINLVTNELKEQKLFVLYQSAINGWVRFALMPTSKVNNDASIVGKWYYEEDLLNDWQSVQNKLATDGEGNRYVGDKLNEFLFYFNNGYLIYDK